VNFINHVKTRRGDKLPAGRDIFTGEIWAGSAAQEVGLIDGIGHLVPVIKARFGDKVKFRRYGSKRGILSRFGADLASDALAGIEERALFARYGL
jgi:ClpP class serine protease